MPEKTCPVCSKPASPQEAPFCSRRCADTDLGRWLTGAYVLPGEPASSEQAGKDPLDRSI
jgi:uncharacterized protein